MIDSGRDAGRENNFDLVRLLAALQVLNFHAITFFSLESLYPLRHALEFFPGVPIFFVVSGFLVSQSWNRAPSVREYAINRVLRVYPALWVCVALSIPIALVGGARASSATELVAWLFAQLTVLQFYNADFLRGLGAGGLNGSLWTIPVELQFYALLPLLAWSAGRRWGIWLAYGAGAALLLVLSHPYLVSRANMGEKILSVSVIPYLFYFLVGIIGRMLFERAPSLFRRKLLHWALLYGVWIALQIFAKRDGCCGNVLSPPTALLLGGLTIAAAFSAPSLANRLLRHNDLSYGIYIYHVPIVNLILFLGLAGLTSYLVLAATVFLLALLSWRLVECPALALKRYSSRGQERLLDDASPRLAGAS